MSLRCGWVSLGERRRVSRGVWRNGVRRLRPRDRGLVLILWRGCRVWVVWEMSMNLGSRTEEHTELGQC